ncbi:MFS transporter [Novosphingobium sp.]|uniref:MFS transporter n=1 Tax=Novosphingobium sp. TaxID=1874826 RepID=UPI003B51E3D8
MKMNWPLFALAIGAFGIGVTEFTPMGILPMIATDLHVSIPTAGLLVSAYAMGVLVGAPVMTLGLARVPRRALLVGLMGVFTAGNLLAAVSGSYAMLFAARVVTSFCHGAYFGVGSVVAASVVAPDKRAGAVATMFSGLTIATIGGVPLAAWVGAMLGWRAAFWGITAVGIVAMVALRVALPPLPVKGDVDIGAELRVVGHGPVLSALALTVLGSSVMFTVFTYIVPILKNATGASQTFVTAMLVLYGTGLTVGNLLGGRFADRSVDGTIVVSLCASIALLVAFAFGMHWWVATVPLVFAWGVASFAIVPSLQTRVMDKARDAPNLASALNIGAFNLGNAIGAALGGAVIGAGLGYPMIPVAGAAMAGAGLILLLVLRKIHPAKG